MKALTVDEPWHEPKSGAAWLKENSMLALVILVIRSEFGSFGRYLLIVPQVDFFIDFLKLKAFNEYILQSGFYIYNRFLGFK